MSSNERNQNTMMTNANKAMNILTKSHNFPSIIELNVGGIFYTTSLSTLTKDSSTMLAKMFSGHFDVKTDKNNRYFIDRDGTHFRMILNFLRDGNIDINALSEKERRELLIESKYYQLNALHEAIEIANQIQKQGNKQIAVLRVRYSSSDTAKRIYCSHIGVVDKEICSGLGEKLNENLTDILARVQCFGWHYMTTFSFQETQGQCISFIFTKEFHDADFSSKTILKAMMEDAENADQSTTNSNNNNNNNINNINSTTANVNLNNAVSPTLQRMLNDNNNNNNNSEPANINSNSNNNNGNVNNDF